MATFLPLDSGDASIHRKNGLLFGLITAASLLSGGQPIAKLTSQSGPLSFFFVCFFSLLFSPIGGGVGLKNLRKKRKIKMGFVLQLGATSLWRWLIPTSLTLTDWHLRGYA
jgi:hypothetical protein